MKKRIVTLICMFTLLFSVGAQALYYPNGGEAYNIGVTTPVFYLGRYWDRVTGYLSERSDPLVLQICADYGIPMKELDDGKPDRLFMIFGGKIYHYDYPEGDPRYPALVTREEMLYELGLNSAFLLQCQQLESGYPPYPFKDVRPYDQEILEMMQQSTDGCRWFDDGIRISVRGGYFSGYAEGHDYYFYPERTMTRAEAVTTLMRAPYEEMRVYSGEITDLVPGAWYEESVQRAYACGFIEGGEFYPDEPATREFAAMLLWKASLLTGAGAELPFADAEMVSPECREAVAALTGAGILTGYGDGSFRPHGTVLRAEFATMLGRLIEGELLSSETPNDHYAKEFVRRAMQAPDDFSTIGKATSNIDIPYPYFG